VYPIGHEINLLNRFFSLTTPSFFTLNSFIKTRLKKLPSRHAPFDMLRVTITTYYDGLFEGIE
jgi:hypothetical protein